MSRVPEEKDKIQNFLKDLSKEKIGCYEVYDFLLLQAGSFGSKQISKNGELWNNSTFRNYWQPTETSSRRSPVNPMMPMPETIDNRVKNIVNKCKGLTCLNYDIYLFLEYIRFRNTENSIIYIDPPYKNTSGYQDCFDWEDFLSELFYDTLAPIYVSEGDKFADDDSCFLLNFNGAKGGMSGVRKKEHLEYLNEFK